jgi:hypothetical protein
LVIYQKMLHKTILILLKQTLTFTFGMELSGTTSGRLLDQQVKQVRKALQEPLVLRVWLGQQDQQEQLVLRVRLVHRVLQELLVLRVFKVQQVLQVVKELQEQLVQPEPLVRLDPKDQQVPVELTGAASG